MKRNGPAIPFECLCNGYRFVVLHAFDLLTSSMSLIETPSACLALAELAQEELGKSLSILAAASFSSESSDWPWFWSGWRNHTLKAHRAFLYELISPVRIEGHSVDGTRRLAWSIFTQQTSRRKGSGFLCGV
jgi:AbiV family abortive infection protein